MAKYYNNKVKTGRLAGSVFAVRYGEVIERAYQPIVANPKSEKQIQARAKLKLLSQFAAVLGSSLPMRRTGAVSSRNKFVAINYDSVVYNNSQAELPIDKLNITNGVLGLNNVVVSRDANTNTVTAQISGSPDLSRVVYICLAKQQDGTLRYIGSEVVTVHVQGVWGPVNFTSTNPSIVVAYGVRDNTENARIVFSNLTVLSAESVAKVIVTRSLLETDVTLTETKVGEV